MLIFLPLINSSVQDAIHFGGHVANLKRTHAFPNMLVALLL